mmetsp:Transcript_28257/g.70145  ORF Transcript_28257/g.70145 Transcript_28257/m.70145 type:complete len:214 (+) Transcript_28257:1107-1748(+)
MATRRRRRRLHLARPTRAQQPPRPRRPRRCTHRGHSAHTPRAPHPMAPPATRSEGQCERDYSALRRPLTVAPPPTRLCCVAHRMLSPTWRSRTAWQRCLRFRTAWPRRLRCFASRCASSRRGCTRLVKCGWRASCCSSRGKHSCGHRSFPLSSRMRSSSSMPTWRLPCGVGRGGKNAQEDGVGRSFRAPPLQVLRSTSCSWMNAALGTTLRGS